MRISSKLSATCAVAAGKDERNLVAQHQLGAGDLQMADVHRNVLRLGRAAEHVDDLEVNRPITRNDELVLPNKLFEYMMAGLAVVAPDLPVVGAFVEREGVGLTYPPGDTAAMGRAIRRLAEDPELLRGCRERGRRPRRRDLQRRGSGRRARPRPWGIAA